MVKVSIRSYFHMFASLHQICAIYIDAQRIYSRLSLICRAFESSGTDNYLRTMLYRFYTIRRTTWNSFEPAILTCNINNYLAKKY